MFKTNVALEMLPCCTNPFVRMCDSSVGIIMGHMRNATAQLIAV
jgi:hypothetical protein